jgi:signal transduction histidine kinase
MKLIYRIILRLSAWLLLLMAAWAVAFYFIMTAEIDDETDDMLEEYAHQLITRVLTGEELPSQDNGTNNTYYLTEVTREWAADRPSVSYTDETVWIEAKMENEAARVLRTVFSDADDRMFELTVAIPSYEKQDLRQRILWWILILYAALLAVVIAANAWIIRRSFRPLYALLGWLDEVRFGETVAPFEMTTDIDEFRRLGEATMRAARRGKEMFDEQRLFTGNAAHELQTPIAVCRSRLEMLAGDPTLGEAQLEQVGSVMDTLDRLAGLNRTLLMLTRIDNHGFPDSAPVDAGAVIRRIAGDYSEVYGHRAITINVNEDSHFRPDMNETLAGVLWGNLLKNAFVHTPDGGRIEVSISSREVSISNSAAAGPLDPVVIFRRFYRGADSAGSTGLGLALVESICRLYGMHIAYDFIEGRHIFTITDAECR